LLPGHDVTTVPRSGWRTLDDKAFLAAASGRIDVFVTIDRGIEHEQNWRQSESAIILVRVARKEVDFYRLLIPDLLAAIETALPAQLIHVPARLSP
jgi:hypothetical protein